MSHPVSGACGCDRCLVSTQSYKEGFRRGIEWAMALVDGEIDLLLDTDTGAAETSIAIYEQLEHKLKTMEATK